MTKHSNTILYQTLASRPRPVAVVTTLAFLWSFIGWPLAAMAQPAQAAPAHAKIKLPPLKIYPAPKLSTIVRKPGPAFAAFDYRAASNYRAASLANAQRQAQRRQGQGAKSTPISLLGQYCEIAAHVTPAQVSAWKREANTKGVARARLAQLNLWLGEIAMDRESDPAGARWHFRMAQSLVEDSNPIAGIAAFDNALCLLKNGWYRDSQSAFTDLMQPNTRLCGFSRTLSSLLLRHAALAVGYHKERSDAGIPEPVRLDPYCAAAGLAAAMRSLGKPYDKATILRACKVTGYGSSLQDVVDAGPKLGVDIRAISADDTALVGLPKPCVAYVEHDHFIAVTSANKHGVTYLCSDCGPWPGGEVHLTWKQWHLLEPGSYAVITKPGSVWDCALAELPWSPQSTAVSRQLASAGIVPAQRLAEGMAAGPKIASVGSLAGLLDGKDMSGLSAIHPILRGRVARTRPIQWSLCGFYWLLNFFGNPFGPVPAGGDPVNLATGAEVYNPAPDLTVYNPVGPSVSWQRLYNSDHNIQTADYGSNPTYQDLDYGPGWSQSYNMEVYDPSAGQAGSTQEKLLIQPNGTPIYFTAPSVPTSGSPSVQCTVQPGANIAIVWHYSSDGFGTFTITWADRTTWTTQNIVPGLNIFPVGQIADRNGNAITLHYTSTTAWTYPLLTSISNSVGTTLLTIIRMPTIAGFDGDGTAISSIVDCNGRTVYYNVEPVPNDASGEIELDHVSEIVPVCSASIPDRYVYSYEMTNISAGNSPTAALHTKTVPSPTGSGTSTATVDYNQGSDYVTDTIDGNGNVTDYFSSDQYGNYTPSASSYTTLVEKDSQGNTLYQYTVGFNANLNTTTVTNGSDVVTTTYAYSDPNDAYMPSSVTDGNGHTTSYTYDQFGNTLTVTQPSPRSTVTTNTYSYANFPMGELTSTQTGSKQATTVSYYEPSGNIDQITYPAPGTVGGSSTVSCSFVYDIYGNLTSVTAPGNGTSSTITATLGYTTDGGYTQSEALGEPITITDNLGKVTHLRFDNQGNVTSAIDPLGNETDGTYDITNSPLTITYPATGESGPNRSYTSLSYLYPGGPAISGSAYDESGNLVRTVNIAYGLDGETLSYSGSTEPVSFCYDGLLRLKTLTDGDGHTTTYTYNTNSYLSSVSYPNANSSTGYDIESYPSYDAQGDLLERVDGRGVVTDYAYADPDNLLTSISYPATPGMNASYVYDGYGRVSGVTDGVTASPTGPGIVPSYDDDNNVTSIQTTYIGQTSGTYLPTQTIGYAFNPDGSTSTLTAPSGTFSFGYDGDGRPNSLTNPFSETTSWAYLDNGWLSAQSLANGVTTTNSFNALGQLLDMSTKNSSSTVLSDFSIPGTGGYDGIGNILSRTDSIAGVSAYSGSTGYIYDAKNQLTQEASTRGGGYTNNFAYDGGTITGAGNPTSFKGATNTFNNDNQYSNTGYAYDGEGNPTTYKGTSLTFDAEDRMTAYGTALTNGYMTCGLRAWKQNSSGTRTYFLYAGAMPICELDSNGDVAATNTFGADGLVSRHVGSTSTYYTFDLQGGNAQRLDSSGSVLGSSMFDSYGSSVSTDGSTDPYSGYGAELGYYTDVETGLIQCTYRSYDPGTGRWLNRDPIGYNGGINTYSYCNNNPVSGIDPLGLQTAIPYVGPTGESDPDGEPDGGGYTGEDQDNTGGMANQGYADLFQACSPDMGGASYDIGGMIDDATTPDTNDPSDLFCPDPSDPFSPGPNDEYDPEDEFGPSGPCGTTWFTRNGPNDFRSTTELGNEAHGKPFEDAWNNDFPNVPGTFPPRPNAPGPDFPPDDKNNDPFGELKPDNPAGRQAGIDQINGRFTQGYNGPGVLYVYSGSSGNITITQYGVFSPP